MRLRLFCTTLVLALVVSIVAPVFKPPVSRSFGLLTVGAFLVTAKIARDMVGGIIKDAEASAKAVLQEFQNQISDLIGQMEATYGSALDTTIDSLDSFTAQQLSRLGLMLDDLNQKFTAGIAAIQEATLAIIQEATKTIGMALSHLEDVIVVGVRGATFVIDKTTYNVAFIIALILMAAGLLFFISRLWKGLPGQKLPRVLTLAFMALYLGLTGALLVPGVRVYAITMTGQAHQLESMGSGPRIFTVTPRKVNTGPTMSLTVAGAGFGKAGAPVVTVAGQAVTPVASGDSFVSLKLEGAPFVSLNGQQAIQIKTADGQVASTTVEFVQPPPPPQIMSYRLVPTGKALEYRAFGPIYVECISEWDSRKTVDTNVTVGEGWTLAIDPLHAGRVVSSNRIGGSAPHPAQGFDEAELSLNNRENKVHRDITYFPEGSQRKTGIRIKGDCAGSDSWFDQWRSWFKANYTVYGKREVAKEGVSIQGVNCVAQGTRKCATYPAPNLSVFMDGKPEAYKVWVTVRTSSGKTEDHFKVLRPGIPEDRIATEGLSVWIESNALWVKGPGQAPPPWFILDPKLPLKPLPIWKP